jgi:predicted nucleic acid-binding protein
MRLLKTNGWHQRGASRIVDFIRKIAITAIETAVYAISPAPKDSYLFNLAIQNNCVFIISNDTLLLNFTLHTVPVHSSSWFLRKFPL